MSSLPRFRSWPVVEVTAGFGAAMLAGKFFADLGCPVASVALHAPDETEAELFALAGGGKEPLAPDWEDRGVLTALLGRARILVADREGLLRLQEALGTADLCEAFPALTACACTWFGVEGPMAHWQGSEEIVQAATGIMSVTAHADGAPTRIAGAPMATAAAMYAVTSAIAAVLRQQDGEPSRLLDVSVYDAALSFHSSSLPVYFLSGKAPGGVGNRHRMWVPWNSFRCADGWVIVCTGSHANWVRLCESMGRPELPAHPLYEKPADRIANVDALEAEITAWTSQRPVAQVERLLNDASIAAGSIVPLHDVLTHPQFSGRHLLDASGRHAGGVFHLNGEPLEPCRG